MVNQFFEDIRDCSLTQIEIYGLVEKITDNFQLNKLKMLYDDFEFFLFCAKHDKEAEFTPEDIFDAKHKFENENLPVPYKEIREPGKDENGKIYTKHIHKIIDLERLLFPFDFVCCYQFRDFLAKEIKQRSELNPNGKTLSPPIKNKITEYFKYIHWNTQADRITDLLTQLKKNKFLHIDTTAAAFKKIFSGEPVTGIIWIGTKTELKYFIKLLYKDFKKIERIRGSYWKVGCSYFVNDGKLQFDHSKFKDLKDPRPTKAKHLNKMVEAL